jgi:hypothetical protein
MSETETQTRRRAHAVKSCSHGLVLGGSHWKLLSSVDLGKSTITFYFSFRLAITLSIMMSSRKCFWAVVRDLEVLLPSLRVQSQTSPGLSPTNGWYQRGDRSSASMKNCHWRGISAQLGNVVAWEINGTISVKAERNVFSGLYGRSSRSQLSGDNLLDAGSQKLNELWLGAYCTVEQNHDCPSYGCNEKVCKTFKVMLKDS